MATKADYYEVLGVERGATADDIKKAYRAAARQHHPDRNPGDAAAAERFKAAAEAYDVLSDADKRAAYDRYGHDGLSGRNVGFGSVDDIFRHFGGGLFEEIFGFGRGEGGAGRGDSYETVLHLTLEEVASGAAKVVTLDRREPCAPCDGTGSEGRRPLKPCVACGGAGEVNLRQGFFVIRQACSHCGGSGKRVEQPCTSCRGSGLVARRQEVKVDVPAGISSGERLRLRGMGDHGANGGQPGDLYCTIEVAKHAIFGRHDEHLVLELPVTYSQLALGAKVEVPTLSGKTLITIPRGAQPGEIVKLAGKGLPRLRRGGTGDLLVRLHLEVPAKVSAAAEKLLRQLAELDEKDVSPPRKRFLERLREYFEGRSSEASS